MISLSDIVRDEAVARQLELSRDQLTSLANSLKSTFGMDVLAKRSVEKAHAQSASRIVFDSIRNVAEAEYLKQAHVYLVGITTPLELRYERIRARGHGTDQVDFETFKRQDEYENTGISSGQNINATLGHCDIIVYNDSTLDSLHHQIDNIIKEGQ